MEAVSIFHESVRFTGKEMRTKDSPLERLCERDAANAREARTAAKLELQKASGGPTFPQQCSHWSKRVSTLRSIAETPFHAMVEVDLYSLDGGKSRCVLYGNTETYMNEVLKTTNGQVRILSWTHPAIQLGLAADLGEKTDVKAGALRLAAVTPVARATFERVLPDVVGLYEPGGAVPVEKPALRRSAPESVPAPVQPEPVRRERKISKGLRSVKLSMTREQVEAFLSTMKGMMMVTGAPGTGKTTVALQRVRFLYDQQDQGVGDADIRYEPDRTRIFLGNSNLFAHCRQLLEKELGLPRTLVSLVPEFIRGYLRQVWAFKGDARPRSRKLSALDQRARAAVFGLCNKKDMLGCWQVYEEQIASRLAQAESAGWVRMLEGHSNPDVRKKVSRLAVALASYRVPQRKTDPRRSGWRMQAVYESARAQYEGLRASLDAATRKDFDREMGSWLFWVYDPLDAVASFFQERAYEAKVRIRKGTGDGSSGEEVFASIVKDWDNRRYGPEEEPWLAWLLRFALPETADPTKRFRLVPWAFGEDQTPETRWTHIVIDEAQDLSVVEASLLSSLVDPRGAMTVSADFRQIVSPVHGMTDIEAFQLGSPMAEAGTIAKFPFGRNLRQSRSIGLFLKEVYQSAFGEAAPFDANPGFDDQKPQLLIANPSGFPRVIKQIFSVLSRSEEVSTVCLLQINEDEVEMKRLRAALEALDVPLAPIWETQESAETAKDGSNSRPQRRLVTTSVERAKGLEYDACIVLGLDDVERSALHFSKNRAYVALSRPARRLILLCQEFPALLHKVHKETFETRQLD